MRSEAAIIIVSLFFVGAVSGCQQRHLTPTDVVGDWKTNRSVDTDILHVAKEILHVKADRTFITNDERGLLLDKGTWRILQSGGADCVNFTYVAARGTRTIRSGDVTRALRRDLAGTRMDISPDDDVYYRKVRP